LKTILYTKDFNEDIKEPVNVILSPQFYWIKKIDIPIKSFKEAKKLAKNLFKLDEKRYKFFALKIDKNYYAIAIEKDLKLNIDKKYIKNIYIAQSELKNFNCINVNEKYIIKKIEDLLFCFPKEECQNNIDEILKNIKLSKNKINLLNTIEINTKNFILINLSILFIAIYFFIQGFAYKKELENIKIKQHKLFENSNLPKTTFQLKAILNNLQSKYKNIQKIKKDLEILTQTPLKKDEYFLKIKFNKDFEIEIKTNRSFDFYFKKFFNVNSTIKNGIYKAVLK